MKTRKTRYSVYNLNYHLVWIPKYRKPLLVGKIAQGLKELFKTSAKPKDVELLAVEIMPDYIHLFVSAPPRYSPSKLVNVFKGVSSRRLKEKYPELKHKIPNRLWTRTYYVTTAGKLTSETIKKYIQEQSLI